MEKDKKYQVYLSPQGVKKFEAIKSDRELKNDVDVWRYCLAEQHEKLFPKYLRPGMAKAGLSPLEYEESKLIAKENVEELKKQRKEEKQIGICHALDGEVVNDPIVEGVQMTGKVCKFKKYERETGRTVIEYDHHVYLEDLGQWHLDEHRTGTTREEYLAQLEKNRLEDEAKGQA